MYTRLVLFSLAGFALWALGRNRPDPQARVPESSTAADVHSVYVGDVDKTLTRERSSFSKRRLATSLTFATLFFAGAALSAGAGDMVAEMVEGSDAPAAAETTTAEAPAEEVPPAEAPPAPEAPAEEPAEAPAEAPAEDPAEGPAEEPAAGGSEGEEAPADDAGDRPPEEPQSERDASAEGVRAYVGPLRIAPEQVLRDLDPDPDQDDPGRQQDRDRHGEPPFPEAPGDQDHQRQRRVRDGVSALLDEVRAPGEEVRSQGECEDGAEHGNAEDQDSLPSTGAVIVFATEERSWAGPRHRQLGMLLRILPPSGSASARGRRLHTAAARVWVAASAAGGVADSG